VCLAIPGKIIRIEQDKQHALVDYGEETTRTVNISLVDVSVGDYVLVHAGFAIEVLEEVEAKKTLELFRQILSQGDQA
jgi:hydrogenase expression/formation protein HypC